MKIQMLELDSLFLDYGSHGHPEEGMCVMEAVSYFAGEPFSDQPKCVCPIIAEFLRVWNDQLTTPERQRLKRFIPLVIGTRASNEVRNQRIELVIDWLIHTNTSVWLELAGLEAHAAVVKALPLGSDLKTTLPAKLVLESAREAAHLRWCHNPIKPFWTPEWQKSWTNSGIDALYRVFCSYGSWPRTDASQIELVHTAWSISVLTSRFLHSLAVMGEGSPSPVPEATLSLRQSLEELLERMITLGKEPA